VAQLSTLGVAPHFMKIRYIILSLLAVSTILFARPIIPYDNSKPPSLSLPAGYELALAALGSATNQFHCISANISTDFGSPGWFFTFYSTNTPPRNKFVTVEFGGKVHVEDVIFR
jgi:hypothetical protein